MKKIIAYLIVLLLFGCAEKHKPDVYTKRYSIGGGAILIPSETWSIEQIDAYIQEAKLRDSFSNVAFEKSLLLDKQVSIVTQTGTGAPYKIPARKLPKKNNETSYYNEEIKLFEDRVSDKNRSASFPIYRVDHIWPFYEFYNGKVFLNDSTGRHELCKCVSETEFTYQDQSSDTLVIDSTLCTPLDYSHIVDSLISLPDPGLILPKIDSAKPLQYYSPDTCKGGIGCIADTLKWNNEKQYLNGSGISIIQILQNACRITFHSTSNQLSIL